MKKSDIIIDAIGETGEDLLNTPKPDKSDRFALKFAIFSACVLVVLIAMPIVRPYLMNGAVQDTDTAALTGETEQTEGTEETKQELADIDEILYRLNNRDIVYYDEIVSDGDEWYAQFYGGDRPRLSKFYPRYEDLQISIVSEIANYATYNRNIFPELGKPVYVKEFDDGKYYILAGVNNIMIKDGLLQANKAVRPVVFAVIERGGYDAEAKNIASRIEDAGNKPVGITEAAEALDAGQSVRLCDINLPEYTELFASALFADPETGEQCRDNNGMIILDRDNAKEFEKSDNKRALAAEIGVLYKKDGHDKKAMIYAYLPADALEDCVKVNEEKMSEEAFVEKYAELAAVYKISDYRYESYAFYLGVDTSGDSITVVPESE